MEDIELHQKHIAQIFSLLTDVKKTFDTAPEKLDTAELPAQFTFTGTADSTDEFGESEDYVARIYRIQFAVIPTGQATPTRREQLCRDLLEKARKHLKKYPSLKQCDRVFKAEVIGDSGVVVLPEFGMAFVGFEIRLRVTYADVITIENQE